jgi:hypothetical protein
MIDVRKAGRSRLRLPRTSSLLAMQRGLALSVVAGVIAALGGCGSSNQGATSGSPTVALELGAPATSSSPLVQLVPDPSTLHNIRNFRGTVVNRTEHSIDWGGCIFSTPWPFKDRPMGYCLDVDLVKPHSRQTVSYRDLVGAQDTPNHYRLLLAYTVGSGTKLSFSWANLTLR